MSLDPTVRFTSRVEDYVAARPTYPMGAVELLVREAAGGTIADVGAGTGILTRQLRAAGAEVVAVEPNAAMRGALDDAVRVLPGTAEATGLSDAAVDLVVAAQAFHWFDREAARREFARVLREPKRVALVWNERVETGAPFLEGYERLLREFGNDYLQVRHRALSPADLDAWFGGGMQTATFANAQRFDLDGLTKRLLSSSYAPQPGDPKHAPMMDGLRRLFEGTHEKGAVAMRYETVVYYGTLGSSGKGPYSRS